MRFKEFLVEGLEKSAQWEPAEIKVLQNISERHQRDFELSAHMIEIGPAQYDDDGEHVYTNLTKEVYRKERGKFMYDINETVSGEYDEYPGNSFRTIDFREFAEKLNELLG